MVHRWGKPALFLKGAQPVGPAILDVGLVEEGTLGNGLSGESRK